MKKKELIDKYGQEWYDENILKKNKERSKQYYYANKDLINQKAKRNKEKNRERGKRYYQTHKDKFKDRKSLRAYLLAYSYTQLDIENGVGTNTITKQWILDNIFSGQVCLYCGENDWHKLGCDRLDNNKPHTPDNCVPSCKKCNTRKHQTYYGRFIINQPSHYLKIWK